MKRTMRTAAFLAAVLVVGCIGWSLAKGSDEGPSAVPAAGQSGGGGGLCRKHGRRAPLAWLFGRAFDRRLMADGYRTMALPVRERELLNLRPGDYVDILSTFDAAMKGGVKEKITATLMQHVKVVGVVKSGDLEGRGALYLLFNPNESQYAALAIYQGEINVIARAEGDKEMKPMEMASFRKLFGK